MNPTADRPDAATEEDPRLVRAAQEYLAALESGRRPPRAEFLARFPDLAEPLAPYLDALDMVHGAGSFAPRSPVQTVRPAAAELPAAEALGDFHIVREIGRGGMGVVYEAVQLSLARRVALKVLPFAAALDAKQLQRFKNEAQAAAQLHHTNIVPVFAVGCERGTHYYAMQLIEGQNLADMICGMRPPDPNPRENSLPSAGAELSTQHSTHSARFYRTAAGLTAQAADALEHAHQFGVIHRDVKPANLIVDERGNVWVTDFGLAQFHTAQGLTRTGDMMGTLRYMSPEQAGGRNTLLDARTDVYSLGATFYELLTLRPLFDGADAHRLLRQILHDEPRRPRAVDRSIPPELETIVLKAVAKNPADRYATAREFADDLRRFLDNRPILARPPSLTQRVRKLARRHPVIVIAAAVLCALTTAGSLVSAWMIHQEQLKTLQREDQARAELKLARQSVDEMFQISEEELAGKPFTEGARKRMLTSALTYYQGLIAQSAYDPDAQKELAASQGRVEKILADLAVLQGGWQVDLLYRNDVKADLALTEDQETRLQDLHDSLDRQRRDDFPAFRQLTPAQRQQQPLNEARAKEAALDKILTPVQQQRLGQIALQLRGLSAFHDAEVAKDLKLTAEQKQQLLAVETEPPPPGPRGEPGWPGRGPGEEFRSPVEKYIAVLNAEQQGRWGEMTGKPFVSDRPPPPPGRDGFGPGHDGPPGPDRGPPPRPQGPPRPPG